MCRVEKEALANELNDLREMMAAEANSRAALQDALAAAERQLGEARNELDMTKTVSTFYTLRKTKPSQPSNASQPSNSLCATGFHHMASRSPQTHQEHPCCNALTTTTSATAPHPQPLPPPPRHTPAHTGPDCSHCVGHRAVRAR
jgi:hypothetical protein